MKHKRKLDMLEEGFLNNQNNKSRKTDNNVVVSCTSLSGVLYLPGVDRPACMSDDIAVAHLCPVANPFTCFSVFLCPKYHHSCGWFGEIFKMLHPYIFVTCFVILMAVEYGILLLFICNSIDEWIILLVLSPYKWLVISKDVIYFFTYSLISMDSLKEGIYLELLSDV